MGPNHPIFNRPNYNYGANPRFYPPGMYFN